MICFLDRTFCSRPLDQCTCSEFRKLTPELKEQSKKWWGTEDAPIAFGVMCSGVEK